MSTSPPAPRPQRPSRWFRLLAPLFVILIATLVAAGCGGEDGGSAADAVAVPALGAGDPLAWLPPDTWLVASANVGAGSIDDAIRSLERLPIWALAEGYLPASDGAGLRLAAIERATGMLEGDAPSPKRLEAAFGDRFGLAITSSDPQRLSSASPPIAAWIEVDDEDAALTAARALLPGSEETGTHRDVTWYSSRDADAAIVVDDGLLVLAPSVRELERLIDTHATGASLIDDATGRAVMQSAIGDSIAAFAIQTDPLLRAIPGLLRAQSTRLASLDGADPATIESTTALAEGIEPLLESSELDGLVPDWVGASITLDTTGLRGRATWSNPRPLTTPDVDARELVERMPAAMPIAQATSMDGAALTRVQRAWADFSDDSELDLAQVIGDGCVPASRWACDLAAAVLATVLEDESLAEAVADAGDATTAIVQDTAPVLRAAANASDPASTPEAAGGDTRFLEIATTAKPLTGWTASRELAAAAAAAGIIVTPAADGLKVTIRIRPASPLGRRLRAALNPAAVQALRLIGIDPRQPLTPAGLTISAQQVDGITVTGLPQRAASQVVPALTDDADVIGDAQGYRDVVDAARPSKDASVYGWVDVPTYVTSVFAALVRNDPTASRATETVRNNLSDIPGALTWSTREDVDGVEVGVLETVAPILE